MATPYALAIFSGCGEICKSSAVPLGICPLVQILPVERDSLSSDGDLPDVWANRVGEYLTRHTEVGRGVAHPDKFWSQSLSLKGERTQRSHLRHR